MKSLQLHYLNLHTIKMDTTNFFTPIVFIAIFVCVVMVVYSVNKEPEEVTSLKKQITDLREESERFKLQVKNSYDKVELETDKFQSRYNNLVNIFNTAVSETRICRIYVYKSDDDMMLKVQYSSSFTTAQLIGNMDLCEDFKIGTSEKVNELIFYGSMGKLANNKEIVLVDRIAVVNDNAIEYHDVLSPEIIMHNSLSFPATYTKGCISDGSDDCECLKPGTYDITANGSGALELRMYSPTEMDIIIGEYATVYDLGPEIHTDDLRKAISTILDT